MTEMTVRKCGGCGAPLPPGVTICEFCNAENIVDSAESGNGDKAVFDVKLIRAGAKLINVIKVIREVTFLGLRESKAMADNVPSVVKSGVTRAEADDIKGKLEEVGAWVEIMDIAARVPVYKTPVTAASAAEAEEAGKKSGPGCLALIGIILLSVFLMCAVAVIFNLDDFLNLT